MEFTLLASKTTLAYYIMESMERNTLKNIKNCLNANIYSNLETSGGQSSNLHSNVVHFFNTGVNKASVEAA